jgi:prepilin-type N-terminal cleavage/methylation domain-containing protein
LNQGFTLLEIIIALSCFLIIIAGIFAISKGTMELSENLTQTQERSMIRQNFVEFLRNSFRRLPGDSEVTLAIESVRGAYVPTLSVFNGGDAFSPGPSLPPDSSVELFSQEVPGGYQRVGIRLLPAEETTGLRSGVKKRRPVGKDDQVLPLIDKVGKFEWRFQDAQGVATDKWENKWKGPNRPLFAELLFALDDGVVTRSVFWIPPITKRVVGPGALQPTPSLGPDGKPLPPGVGPDGQPLPVPTPTTNPGPKQ